MKQLMLLILLMGALVGYTQDYDYNPSLSKMPSKKKFKERIDTTLQNQIGQLDGKNKDIKEITAIYQDRANYLLTMADEEDEFIFNTDLNTYLETIFQNILKANPQIDDGNYQLLLSRDIAPNASNLGEGTIVMNIGLIRRLANESQIAFVLAHEIAHQTSFHVNQHIIDYVEHKNLSSTQREIKQITKQKYNRNRAGMTMLKSVVYNGAKHSRYKESEADSLAVELLKNTEYDLSQAPKALELLDSVDDEKYQNEYVLHREFNRDLYPFKPEWKVEDNPLEGFFQKDNTNEILGLDEEQLKTHAEPKKRALELEAQIGSTANGGKVNPQGDQAYQQAVQQADFDYILSAYHYDNYGYAIYQALQLLQEYPNHPFLVGIIGASMGEMVDAIDHHELGKVLPLSSPEFEDDYNDLLKFLNNLSMQEMKEVAWNYVAIYQDQAEQSDVLTYALALTAKEKNKKDLYNKYKKSFMSLFPNSYFIKKARKL